MAARISNQRWYAKKAARLGILAGTWASGWLALRDVFANGPRVRVLTYHRFGDSPFDPFCVSLQDFEAQMRFLADKRLAISLSDVEAFLAGEKELPNGTVLVTIDDGYRSVYTKALSVLSTYGIPAIAFVVVGGIDRDHMFGGEQLEEYMTWDELEQVTNAGVVIGSHSFHHRSLGRMPLAQAQEEASRSRELLEERLGRTVRTFAYPFGTQADFNRDTGRVLTDAGYSLIFTSQHGALVPGMDPASLPRVKVEAGEGLWFFEQLCRGGMDGWRWVDRHLWRAQTGPR